MMKVILLLAVAGNLCESASILAFFPTPSISHQIVYRALTQDLASRGHSLTILTPNPVNSSNPNVTEIDLSFSYPSFHKMFNYAVFREYRHDQAGFIRKAMEIFNAIMEEQLSHPNVKKFIDERAKYKFDVMIMEQTGFLCYLALAEIFKVPVIGIASFESGNFIYQAFGSEANFMIHSEQNFPFPHGELTFYQRWQSLKSQFVSVFGIITSIPSFLKMNEIVKTHFPMVNKSIFELLERVEILLVNTNPGMGYIRPLVPLTVQLGFMHIVPPKPLPEGDLKSFLDNSKNGVIYMSFGSNIKSKDLGADLQALFANVFRKLDYDVIWKLETEDLPNKPKNVYLSKWLPQPDLLAHPKIKLFITQGGHQSVEEAVDRTVPMIVVPFLGDQPLMAINVQKRGAGRMLDIDTLTEEEFLSTIQEVLKPIYKENVVKLRELVYDQPMSSREKAVWWTEYVIRHKGAKHLAYPGRLTPFYQKYCLDFIGIALALLIIFNEIFKAIYKKLYSKKIKNKKE